MPYHTEQTRVKPQQGDQAKRTACGFSADRPQALSCRPPAGEGIMVGHAKPRLERLARLKCDIADIADARHQPFDLPHPSVKANTVVGNCGPSNTPESRRSRCYRSDGPARRCLIARRW